MEKEIKRKGCGSLFKSEMGNILICGEDRPDENCFLCRYCLDKKEIEQSVGKIENYLKEFMKGGK